MYGQKVIVNCLSNYPQLHYTLWVILNCSRKKRTLYNNIIIVLLLYRAAIFVQWIQFFFLSHTICNLKYNVIADNNFSNKLYNDLLTLQTSFWTTPCKQYWTWPLTFWPWIFIYFDHENIFATFVWNRMPYLLLLLCFSVWHQLISYKQN